MLLFPNIGKESKNEDCHFIKHLKNDQTLREESLNTYYILFIPFSYYLNKFKMYDRLFYSLDSRSIII